MTLKESRDLFVRDAAPILVAGRKWSPASTVAKAKAALRHQDTVGDVQHGRGLHLRIPPAICQKAIPYEHWQLRCARAVCLKPIKAAG